MAQWDIDLSDGRTVTVESDHEPNEDEIMSSLKSVESPTPDIGGSFMFDPQQPWLRNQSVEQRPLDERTLGERTSSNLALGGVGLQEGFHGLGEQGWSMFQAANEPILELGPIALTPSGVQPTARARERAQLGRDIALQARESSQELQPLASEIQQTGAAPIMRTVGQAVPSVAPALAAGPLGVAAPIIAGGAQAGGATLSEAQSVFEQQPEARRKNWLPNAEFWDAAAPAALDAAQTSILTAVSGRIFGRGIEGATVPAKREAVKNAVANRAKGVLGETLEEGAQQFVSDYVVAGMSYNPEITFEQAFDNAIKAAIAGGVVGAGVETAVSTSQPQRTSNAIQPEGSSVPSNVQQPEVAQESTQQVPAAEGSTKTAEALVAKPPGETTSSELMSLSDEEAQKFFSGNQARQNSTQFDSVLAGMKMSKESIPELEKAREDAQAAAMKAAASGDNVGYMANFGKVVWINGAIEGINRSGPNFESAPKVAGNVAGVSFVRTINSPSGKNQWMFEDPAIKDESGMVASFSVPEGSAPSVIQQKRDDTRARFSETATPTQNEETQEEVLAGAAPEQAVAFLPRMSEITGAGEPSLPPTVADVQQQRATEARESGIAPGDKTTPSQGNWFAGMNPRETSRMMQDRATTFLQGKTDEQAITDIARMAGGDPSVQLDHQAANFAIKDLLVKINRLIQTTENPVYQAEAWQKIDRLAELSRRMGAEDARSLVSRQLAYKQIDWLMPVLTWRNIVQSKWRNALGIEPNQSIDEAIAKLPKEEKDKLLKRLPELDGDKAKKLEELSRRAKTEPQGVKRNKTMEEMVKLIQSDASISKTDLLRDLWYSSVLMRIGTFVNVLAGSYSTGASFAGLAAIDRLARLKPLQAMKIIGQFIGGTIEGTLIADQIARKGAYHLLPDAEQRMVNLLTGKAGARFDNLEELLRRGNPVGVLAYTRRFMAALDYIGALGTRDSQVLYAALTRGDQESLAAVEKRFDKALNKRAEQQARDEMGPKASRAEVLSRKREILEEGVSEEIQEAALHTARRAAQNAEPRGIPGIIYKGVSKLPFWVRAPTGLAFIRAGMNMVQNAVDYMPGIGALAAARGYAGTLPKNHPLNRMGLGLDIPIEERRMMWVAQAASFGIAATAAAMFLGDEDDKEDGWEISGSWRGLDPKKRSQLMELGERPNSIRFGKNSPWISFKQMPFAPPLAMIGTMRDEERFHAKDWDAESAGNKLVAGWLSGLMYVRDLSALSGIAGIFDANAWSTQDNPTKTIDRINRWGAQSIGRAGAGYIPSILKEIDEFADPTLYRPSKDEMFGWWLRNIPYARRTEKPALNNFGEAIQQTRPPIKSWAGFGKDNDLYNTLGELASRGIFLPEPDKQRKIVDDNGEYREMTEDEWYKFIQTRGPILKEGFTPAQLEFLREANDEEKVEWLKDHAQKSTADAVSELWPLTRYDFMRKTK